MPAPHLPGAGEFPNRVSDGVEYVWANNPSAVVGTLMCVLLLISWFKYAAPSLSPEGEEDDGS